MELKVMLKDEKEVQEFVQAASVCPEAIDLKSGAIYLDAKSLLGVMSMGRSERCGYFAVNMIRPLCRRFVNLQ